MPFFGDLMRGLQAWLRDRKDSSNALIRGYLAIMKGCKSLPVRGYDLVADIVHGEEEGFQKATREAMDYYGLTYSVKEEERGWQRTKMRTTIHVNTWADLVCAISFLEDIYEAKPNVSFQEVRE